MRTHTPPRLQSLLSFKSDLIKSKDALSGATALRKSDIDEALKRASLAEVKASLRMLRVYLEVESTVLPPSPASTLAPSPSPALSLSSGTPTSTAAAASATAAEAPAPTDGAAGKSDDGDVPIQSRHGSGALASPELAAAAGGPNDRVPSTPPPSASLQAQAGRPALDDVAVLSNLSATVTRLSIIMSHLLGTLPLASLLGAAEASSLAGDSSAAIDGSNGTGAHTGSGGVGSGKEDEEGERASMRQLLSIGVQLMLREHKQPFIDKLISTMPIMNPGSPSVTIDRFKAMTTPGHKNEHTMLAQLRERLNEGDRRGLSGDRWWRVNYVGEDGSDAGGLFRDSVSALAAECQRGAEDFPCPLFVQMDLFQVDRAGSKQLAASYLVPNPACDFAKAEELYEFVGQLMGACSRSSTGGRDGEKFPIALAPLIWRMLLGHELRWEDIAELEPELDTHVRKIGAAAAPNGSSSSCSWVELQLLVEHLDDPSTSKQDLEAFWEQVCSNLRFDDNVPDLVRDRVCICSHLQSLCLSHDQYLRSSLSPYTPYWSSPLLLAASLGKC